MSKRQYVKFKEVDDYGMRAAFYVEFVCDQCPGECNKIGSDRSLSLDNVSSISTFFLSVRKNFTIDIKSAQLVCALWMCSDADIVKDC